MRRTRDQVLMDIAYAWSARSTCTRGAVGAVIAIGNRTIASGYNGAPAGMPHCDHTCNCGSVDKYGDDLNMHDTDCPSQVGCTLSVHAEANAIAFAARHGVSTQGGILYTTIAPCFECAKLIINAGLVCCVYGTPYRLANGVDLLELAQVSVVHLT